MKSKMLCGAGMLVFCLFVLFIPLKVMEKAMDYDENKVKSISDKGSKKKIEFAVGKENYNTKLLLLSGKLKSDKEIITGDKLSSLIKKEALTVARLEISSLHGMGYYRADITEENEKDYEASVEEYRYSEQIFGKYNCRVWKVVFQNKSEKHTIILDADDFTTYYLEMDLNKDMDTGFKYTDDKENEFTAYICPLNGKSQMISLKYDDGISTAMSINPAEKNIEKVEKVKENEYLITEKDGTAYYAELEKMDKYLKFELLPQL